MNEMEAGNMANHERAVGAQAILAILCDIIMAHQLGVATPRTVPGHGPLQALPCTGSSSPE